MRVGTARTLALAAGLLVLAGCAGPGPVAGRDDPDACRAWIVRLDAAIDSAGVRDAQAHRLHGLDGLRVDRFTAALRDRARSDEAALVAWLGRMQALDADARRHELANLPDAALASLAVADRAAALTRTRDCAVRLSRRISADDELRETLFERARVPDDYSTLLRALGLYAVTSLPFSWGIDDWHRAAREAFATAQGTASPAGHVLHVPATAPVAAEAIHAIFARVALDALGVPQLDDEDAQRLLDAHAPVFEVERTGPWDDPGRIEWSPEGEPRTDPSRPTVYRRLAWTRFRGQALVQLVYTIWFPERPADTAWDLLAGRLDGVVVRVTLDQRGVPLAWDTMHPCGCWHMFLPTARLRVRTPPQPRIEWAFVPAGLPALPAGQRMRFRIASRTHFVVDARADSAAEGARYTTAPDDELRSLPLPGGGRRSLYAPNGIVAATERPERFVFWPMGIESAGAMRQWGRHATAFLGRRHFDDADLFDRRFEPAD